MNDGDPRRCERHPNQVTSSLDGMFDTPCPACEAEADFNDDGTPWEPPSVAATRLKDLTVEELRKLLIANDPNGCWTDEERAREGFDPLSKEHAYEIIDQWCAEDPDEDIIGILLTRS